MVSPRQKPGGRKSKLRKPDAKRGPTVPQHKPAGSQQEDARRLSIEQTAFDLRLSGLTYSKIAEQLDKPRSTVYDAVQRVMGRMQKELGEKAEQLRQIQTMRLESLIQAVWDQALGKPPRQERGEDGRMKVIPAEPPDLEAGKLIAGTYIPQLAKLNGLYQAEQLQIGGGIDPVRLELENASTEDLEQISRIYRKLVQNSKPSDGGGPGRIPPGRLIDRN